tara:strand:- start:3692 stop:3958 length:267 start_codon:yes stop_codon:yes gene_type:complete
MAKKQNLPGMEDRAIEALESAAIEYAEVRDQRIALNAGEVQLKGRLLGLMKQHKRERYENAAVSIRLVHEKETVKVKIKKPKKKDDED